MMILVLGGGYLGSNLLDNFAKAGHQIHLGYRTKVTFYDYKIISHSMFTECDFSQASLEACIEKVKPDIIVNCIGHKNVEKCETDRVAALDANVLVAQKILDAIWMQEKLNKHIPSHFFHLSTDYVYSGSGQNQWKVNDKLNPSTFYGLTKSMAESLIMKMPKLRTRSVIIRAGGIYGYKMPLIESLIQAHKDKKPFQAYTNVKNSAVSSQFLAQSILKMSKYITEDAIVHVGSSVPYTRYSLCLKIIKALNLTVELKSSIYAGKLIPFNLSMLTKEYAELTCQFDELINHYQCELPILPTESDDADRFISSLKI